MKRTVTMAGIAILASLAGTSAALAVPPVAAYSSMCYGAETGDIGGKRMSIVRFPDNETYVIFQSGEGALMDAEMAKANLNASTGALSFKLKNQTIKGTLTNDSFAYKEYNIKEVLPRLSDYQARLPGCRQ